MRRPPTGSKIAIDIEKQIELIKAGKGSAAEHASILKGQKEKLKLLGERLLAEKRAFQRASRRS